MEIRCFGGPGQRHVSHRRACRDVDGAARSLLKLRDERLDTPRTPEPAMLAVIVSTGVSYLRQDGVAVVAVGALGP